MSFWQELQKKKIEGDSDPAAREHRGCRQPIIGLAPMDGVTDAPFRYMTAKYGKPDVIYTEFVSVDALHHNKGTERWERVIRAFQYDETERPIVAQIFGSKPELFADAAKLIEEMGFDGVDINMGCPAKKVSENGAGAGLIRNPELAREIIRVVKGSTNLPVSVKTRVGVDTAREMEEWIVALMKEEPAAIALHGRTLRQMYTGRADWEAIQRAGEIIHELGGIILGNGDVGSLGEAGERVSEYGVDGVLIGRASFGNPGVFAGTEPDKKQRVAWMLEHARKYEQYQYLSDSVEQCLSDEQKRRNFLPMRKHLTWYAKGFPGASELRQQLVRCSSVSEVERVVGSI